MSRIIQLAEYFQRTAQAGALAVAAPPAQPIPPPVNTTPDRAREHVPTPTAGRVLEALIVAQRLCSVALVYGAQGVGKTAAARAFVDEADAAANAGRAAYEPRRNCGVWYVTADPAASTMVAMLKRICAAMEALPPERSDGAADLHQKIIQTATEHRERGLLIVDEAQHLAFDVLEQLRAIHDEASIGLALLGSFELEARLVGGKAACALDSLRARVGRAVVIEGNTPEDADAVADAWGFAGASARKEFAALATGPGGLRAAVRAARFAQLLAQKDGRNPTGNDLEAAICELNVNA